MYKEQLRDAVRNACDALRMFPLPNVVFLPHTVLPLHVFEPRYRSMVTDCLAGNRILAVPLLQPGWESSYDERPAVFPVAGVGQIVHAEKMSDGRFNIAMVGLGRVRIHEEHAPTRPYREVRAELLPEVLPDRSETVFWDMLVEIERIVAQLVAARPADARDLSALLEDDFASDNAGPFLDNLAHVLLGDIPARQRYLETDAVSARAEMMMDAACVALAGAGMAEA